MTYANNIKIIFQKTSCFVKSFFCGENAVYFILLMIIFCGTYLRMSTLDATQLWIDEGFTIMQHRAIVAHGHPLLMSGLVEWKDVLMPYLLAIFTYTLGGENLLLFKYVSAFFGAASIIIIFLVVRNLINKNIALITSFMFVFSYWHVAWSHQIRSYTMVVFFLLLTILFITYYEKNNQWKYLALAAVSVFFAILAKTSLGLLLVPAFLLYLLLKRQYAILLIACVPMLFVGVSFSRLFLNTISDGIVNYGQQYLLGYLWGYFGLIFLLSITGWILAFRKDIKNRHIHIMLLSIVFTAFLFFSFFSYISQFRYLFFITPIFFIYSTYFLYFVGRSFSSSKKKSLLITVGIFLAVLVIDFASMKSFTYIPQERYYLEHATPQPEFFAGYQYINSVINDNDRIISPYPYMDYIFLNRFDYALPISYTGKETDLNIHYGKEFYTGAQALEDITDIEEVHNDHDIYFIFDDMGNLRVKENVMKYINDNAMVMYKKIGNTGQGITVYKMSQKK